MKCSTLAVSLIFAACLAGCSSTGGEGSGSGAAAASRDRLTESDESHDTRRARVRMELAAAYYSRGQLATALDEVKLALSADPKLVGAINLRGLIYAGLGDDVLAEDSFKRALSLDARDPDTMHNYGWYLCQRRRFAEADALFDRVLVTPLYGQTQRTLIARGTCQSRAGQFEQAEQTLMRALELDTSSPLASLSLAEVLYRRGQYDRARFYIRRVNSNPDIVTPQSLWLGARVENKLNNPSGVDILSRQLRDRFPRSSEAVALERGQFDD